MASAVKKFLQQTDLSGHELYPVEIHGGKPDHVFTDMKALTCAAIHPGLTLPYGRKGNRLDSDEKVRQYVETISSQCLKGI